MEDVALIVSYLRTRVKSLSVRPPEIAIVCGSGLSKLSELIQNPIRVPYADIPNFPQSTVAGHGTELVFGTLGSRSVVAQRGRFHHYEGNAYTKVALPVRVFAALGCKVMIATNAAGGLNAGYKVGDIMIIKDHVSFPTLTGGNPLVGPNDEAFGPRFPGLTYAYPASLQAVAEKAAQARGLGPALQKGVYYHCSGPTYETPHEIRAMRILGGDSVGMSTVPEVVAAAHCGMAVLGLSLITNQCRAPGDTGVAPSHEEVLEATEKRSFDMQNLVADICAAMDLKDFPAPKVAEVFAGGAGPVSKASRGGSGGSGGGNQVVLAAAVGGVVGAMIASAVILALRK